MKFRDSRKKKNGSCFSVSGSSDVPTQAECLHRPAAAWVISMSECEPVPLPCSHFISCPPWVNWQPATTILPSFTCQGEKWAASHSFQRKCPESIVPTTSICWAVPAHGFTAEKIKTKKQKNPKKKKHTSVNTLTNPRIKNISYQKSKVFWSSGCHNERSFFFPCQKVVLINSSLATSHRARHNYWRDRWSGVSAIIFQSAADVVQASFLWAFSIRA